MIQIIGDRTGNTDYIKLINKDCISYIDASFTKIANSAKVNIYFNNSEVIKYFLSYHEGKKLVRKLKYRKKTKIYLTTLNKTMF